jgi:hypothetical protein
MTVLEVKFRGFTALKRLIKAINFTANLLCHHFTASDIELHVQETVTGHSFEAISEILTIFIHDSLLSAPNTE